MAMKLGVVWNNNKLSNIAKLGGKKIAKLFLGELFEGIFLQDFFLENYGQENMKRWNIFQ